MISPHVAHCLQKHKKWSTMATEARNILQRAGFPSVHFRCLAEARKARSNDTQVVLFGGNQQAEGGDDHCARCMHR